MSSASRPLCYAHLQPILIKLFACPERGTAPYQRHQEMGRASITDLVVEATKNRGVSVVDSHNNQPMIMTESRNSRETFHDLNDENRIFLEPRFWEEVNPSLGAGMPPANIRHPNVAMMDDHRMPQQDEDAINGYLHQSLHNRRVRDIFSGPEEAFILMVIRKHLRNKFGTRVFATVAVALNDTTMAMDDGMGTASGGNLLAIHPRHHTYHGSNNRQGSQLQRTLRATRNASSFIVHQRLVNDGIEMAPALPDINDDEVVWDEAAIQVEDVRYQRRMQAELEDEESLKASSVWFSMNDTFNIPLYNARSTSSASLGERITPKSSFLPLSPQRNDQGGGTMKKRRRLALPPRKLRTRW